MPQKVVCLLYPGRSEKVAPNLWVLMISNGQRGNGGVLSHTTIKQRDGLQGEQEAKPWGILQGCFRRDQHAGGLDQAAAHPKISGCRMR